MLLPIEAARAGEMTFSPRYLVAANLLLLAMIAYSASAIVGNALASRLMPPPEVKLSHPPPPIPQQPPRPATYYALISQRDIFNSVKKEEPAAPAPAPPPPAAPLNVKLWGVAVHDGKSSYCVIEDLQTRLQGLYRLGDVVKDGATVKEVAWDHCTLTRNGQDEVLELAPSPAGGPPTQLASIARPQVQSATIISHNIKQLTEGQFLIDRSEVDQALDNMSQLFTQIRAVPHFEGGRSVGFRLFAIRPGSLFDKIGLRNGDIIKAINGIELNDPGRALTMLNELREESNLSVELVRNRQPQTLSYQIR
jgi:general secretion pathway protein C